MEESILDKVISSKQSQELREFNPPEVVASLFKQLSNKEEDILRRRYGLNGKEKQTLEEIGQVYQLTRERIRQIESTSVKKIRQLKNFHNSVEPIEHTIKAVLEQNGGALAKEKLMDQLFEMSTDSPISRQSVAFIISRLLNDVFMSQSASGSFRASWRLPSVSLERIRIVNERCFEVISKSGQPLSESALLKQYRAAFRDDSAELDTGLSDHAILGYVTLSQKISRNPFGDYGLTEWGTIVPKRMNDKIYLVLKKEGKPMHFTKIAEQINKIGFDKRQAYPPTVHNELILNDRYVLVGRGIYALKEWGYKPGVVADVIGEVLKKVGEPLSRQEIVKRVLEQRMVKRNTIHLALTDQKQFTKLPDGRYQLANHDTPPPADTSGE